MAKQTINIGAAPNDGTGTPLRTSFDYCNLNFTELYTATGPSGNNIVVPGTATITGDLTVDTSTLKVDSTNNRVGIGTASPLYALDVRGTIAGGNGTIFGGVTFSSRTEIGALSNHDVGIIANSVTQYLISTGGNHTWFNGGSTAMTLNSTGLGVGGPPGQRLDIVSTTGCVARVRGGSGAGQSAAFYVSNTAGTSTLAAFGDGANMIGGAVDSSAMVYAGASIPLVFYVNSAERMRIDSAGNVGIGVTPSAGKGCLQLSSGINFPATQVASSDVNTLDDYEEGTWTIGLTFGGGSTGITTATNTGRYTKIGRQVTVSGNLSLSNKGSSTGIAEIQGLPFTIANANEAYSAANVRFNGVSFADIPISIGAIGSTKILLQEITKAGVVTDITDADFTNTSSCIIGFTYTV
jgi:hypothetical protein